MRQMNNPVTFPVDSDDWINVHRLGKVLVQATNISKARRITSERGNHRVAQVEAEGGVRIKSKLFDTSKFVV